MNNARSEYGDIIDLPHHQSDKHPHMTLHDRAAQFAPFAALRGYDDEITESARLTDKKPELSAEDIDGINETLGRISENIKDKPQVRITYFVPDEKKDGGACVTVTGSVRRIDETERIIHLSDGGKISIYDLLSINIITE